MLDVTFSLSPFDKVNPTIPWATRILTSNLKNNKRINAKFSNISILSNMYYNKYYSQDIHRIFKNKKFKDYMIESTDSDIIMISSSTHETVAVADEFLKRGKKVVLGGAATQVVDSKLVRKMLYQDFKNKNLDNLMIIKGYVDKTTDLYSIIKNWKDCEIIDYSNIHTVFECEDDYFLDHLNNEKLFKYKPFLSVVFDQICYHNKCKFCSFKKLPRIRFYKDVNQLLSHLQRIFIKYKTDKLWIADSSFVFNKDKIKVLESMKNNDNKITIYTTVNQLKSKKYIEYLNLYVDEIIIGVESFCDWTLNTINKGHTLKDIQIAFNNMLKFMKKDMMIMIDIITDLPVKNINDVYYQYGLMRKMKKIFKDEGFDYFKYLLFYFTLTVDSELIDGKYLKIVEKPTSGRRYMYDYIEQIKMAANLSRYDENNKLIPSDFDLIDDIDNIRGDKMNDWNK